jgi:hypothetical protein
MKVIKFEPGLIPVLKHQEHDQSSHGNWAAGSLWKSKSQDGKTILNYQGEKGKLSITIPDEIAKNPDYKDAINNFVKRVEGMQSEYPIPDLEMRFSAGESTKAGHIATTYSASLDGVPQTTSMDFSEAVLKNPVGGGLAEYALAHEWGHGLDTRSRETAAKQGARFSQAKFEDDSIPMTDYGYSSDREAYAEAFAIKFLNSHKGGVWRNNTEQTDKWEEVFKIFELDSLKKAKGERVSFLVKDTFDANNPPVLIEDYTPPVEKHAQHNQADHGNWAKGGNGLGIEETMALLTRSDPIKRKIYDAENSLAPKKEKTKAPDYPKIDDFPSKDEYDKAYKEYSKKWMAWVVDEQANIVSKTGEDLLDGTPSGVRKYVEKIIKEDWFIEQFGDGSSLPKIEVKVGDSSVAGRHILSFQKDRATGRIVKTRHEIAIDRQFTKDETAILHEISHYATAINQTENNQSEGLRANLRRNSGPGPDPFPWPGQKPPALFRA